MVLPVPLSPYHMHTCVSDGPSPSRVPYHTLAPYVKPSPQYGLDRERGTATPGGIPHAEGGAGATEWGPTSG
jgi:hypothetical protein